MTLSRRTLLSLATGAVALPTASRLALAQAYPARAVHLLVGFAAGSASDIIARLIAQKLSEQLGQPVVVENRPGAGTNIAAEAVTRAPADGYTLLLATSTNAVNTTLYQHLSFNFSTDIAPVALIDLVPYVLEVTPSLPAKTLPEFIAYAKANPGKINMASNGIGSGPHVAGELFKMMAGVDLVHVPYTGNPYSDLIGGQIQVMFSPIPASIGYVRSGQLRRSRSAQRHGSQYCRTCRPWPKSCRATMPAAGTASARRKTRRRISSKISTRRSVPISPMPLQDEDRRSRRRADGDDVGPVRQVHRRRDREVGQGQHVRRYQSRMSFRADNFCTWLRERRSRLCSASRACASIIRHGRCGWSTALPLAAQSTFSRGCCVSGCRRGSVAVRGRQQTGCGDQHRDRGSRSRGARWLYAIVDHDREHHQCDDLQ